LTVALSARYKAALAAALLAVPGLALAADKVAGAVLPDDATKVAENRYKVPRSYDETLRFYRQVYGPGRYTRRPIADQPGLKAVHIDNPDAKPGAWEGLNVYELKGETRVYVLVRPREERARGTQR
jgi:hypothetical protein